MSALSRILVGLVLCGACGGPSSPPMTDAPPPDDGPNPTTLDPADCTPIAANFVNAAEMCGTTLPSGAQQQLESTCRRGIAKASLCGGDRDTLALQLEFARCNRNLAKLDDAVQLANHCQRAIERAASAQPARHDIANLARTRLGHFQRLLGKPEQARATLKAAVDEAVRVHGATHPDTAVARYSLGIAEISEERFDEGIAELRSALEIRRAAFAGNHMQIAESLQGLADALASKGDHHAATPLLEQALAILDALEQPESPLAANVRIMLAMSLQQLARDDDASAHYLRGADIADRVLEHGERIAVLGLQLAAEIAVQQRKTAVAVAHLERALRLQERSKRPPVELGKTQQRLAQLILTLGPAARVRAQAMATVARASFVAAAAKDQVTAIDEWMRKQGWR